MGCTGLLRAGGGLGVAGTGRGSPRSSRVWIVCEPRRLILGVDAHGDNIGVRSDLGFFGAIRAPCSGAQPGSLRVDSIAMKRIVDRKQTQRTSRLLGLVNSAGFDRHRDGIGFVSRSVPELVVDENGDWDQRSFAIVGHLKDGQSPRTFVLL